MNVFPRLDRIVTLHRDRAAALGVAMGAALLLLVATDVIGHLAWYGLIATVAACSILLADSDSFAGLILLAAMVVQWLDSGMSAGTWWAVPAAWLLLIAHAAVALAADGPDPAAIPRATLATWLRRIVLVGPATTAVGTIALVIRPTDVRLVPYGVAAALIALVVAVLVLLRLTGDAGSRS